MHFSQTVVNHAIPALGVRGWQPPTASMNTSMIYLPTCIGDSFRFLLCYQWFYRFLFFRLCLVDLLLIRLTISLISQVPCMQMGHSWSINRYNKKARSIRSQNRFSACFDFLYEFKNKSLNINNWTSILKTETGRAEGNDGRWTRA